MSSAAMDGTVDMRKLQAGFAVAAVGILLAMLQMAPPDDVTLSTLDGNWRHSRFLDLNPSGGNIPKLITCRETVRDPS